MGRKQLIIGLIVGCVLISTSAYADGWILWGGGLPDKKDYTSRLRPMGHGYEDLNACKENAKIALEKILNQAAPEDYMIIKEESYFMAVPKANDGKPEIGAVRVCYPSDFDPRDKY